MRNTFEFRNKTWINKKIFNLLEKENIALCMADHPDFLNDLPAPLISLYQKTRGGRQLYDVVQLPNRSRKMQSSLRTT